MRGGGIHVNRLRVLDNQVTNSKASLNTAYNFVLKGWNCVVQAAVLSKHPEATNNLGRNTAGKTEF